MLSRVVRAGDAVVDGFERGALVSKWLVVVLVLVHVVVWGSGAVSLERVCLSVAPSGLLARLLVSPLVHAGLLHLALNCVGLLSLGKQLELRLGSARFAVAVATCLVLAQLLQVALEMGWRVITRGASVQCSVGFSGVLFALYVLDVSRRTHEKMFGCFMVPAAAAPWILLGVMNLAANTSFVGHLAGIVAGYGYLVMESRLQGLVSLSDSLLHQAGESFQHPSAAGDDDERNVWPFSVGVLLGLPERDLEQNHPRPPPPAAHPAQANNQLNEHMRVLVELGFDRVHALNALRLGGGTVEGAIEVLAAEDVV